MKSAGARQKSTVGLTALACLARVAARAMFLFFPQVYALQEDYKSAIDVYTEARNCLQLGVELDCQLCLWASQALEFSPEHAELLTTLGILYLRCLGGD